MVVLSVLTYIVYSNSRPESQPLTNVAQGSWLAPSTSPPSFIPSLSQSATPTVTTPVTAPPPFAALQSTLTFAPVQSPGLSSKPGLSYFKILRLYASGYKMWLNLLYSTIGK